MLATLQFRTVCLPFSYLKTQRFTDRLQIYNFTLFCMGVKLGVSQEVKNLDD